MQVALAFYLIHLHTIRNARLRSPVARDRVVGILLGLFMMWLVFDQLWGTTALVQMKKDFTAALRLLAQFAREPVSADLKVAIERSYSLRESDQQYLRPYSGSSADAVLFEFGPSREQDLALRSRIKEWQPQLRTLFLMRIALWKFRVRLPGFELPQPVRVAQQEFDYQSGEVLDNLADRLEEKSPRGENSFEKSFEHLQERVRTCCSEGPQNSLSPELQTFLALSRNVESLTVSLSKKSDL